MTGIERLREFVAGISPFTVVCRVTSTAYDREHMEVAGARLHDFLAEIADEIERDFADARMGHVSLMRILEVVTKMERHILGHEGMEDSPVARWARELRDALKSYTSDGRDTQNPSCADPDGAADVTSEAPKVTRDPAEDVSMSAYDLLPSDERDAIAWVLEHGGLDYVKKEWRSRVPHDRYEARRQRLLGHIAECETALGRRREIISKLGHRVSDLTRENAELRRRAMPESCEWPRYESGDLVMFGDCVENRNGTCTVNSVRFYSGGGVTVYGEGRGAQFVVVTEPVMHDPIRKANPKVLAADGEPLEVGQTVWDVDGYGPLIVKVLLSKDDQRVILDNGGTNFYRYPDNLTHHRPVLDADCVPIKVGDTVWDVEFGCEHVVTKVSDGAVFVAFEDESADRCDPASLTHRAPVLAADGRPLREGQTVWDTDAEADTPLTVVEVSSDMVRCEYTWKDGKTYRPCYPPDQLTHQRLDTWQRIEEDLTLSPEVYCHRNGIDISQKDGTEIFLADTVEPMARDLVRRCRALAERERGE